MAFTGTVYIVGEPGTPATCSTTRKVPDVPVHLYDGGDALRTGSAAGGDASGTFGALTVARLQGNAVATGVPSTGQVLTWNGTSWAPATPAAGATAHAQLSGLAADDHGQYLLANGSRSAPNGFAVAGTFGSGTLAVSGAGTRLVWYPRKAAFRAGRVEGAQWDDASVGPYSMAAGFNVTASDEYATALGSFTTASGYASTALGQSTTASGRYATAMGLGAVASGDGSTALGRGTTASSGGAVAMGNQTTASGGVSFAMGDRATASGHRSSAIGSYVSTDGQDGSFVIGDASTRPTETVMRASAQDQFSARFAGGYRLYTNGVLGAGVTLSPGSGSWQSVSDVRRKTGFRPVDGEALLAKLAAMPVQTWQYRSQAASIRHMGPTAQDFHRAFGVGESDTTITTIDADGVALAAARALERRTRTLLSELATLRSANQALRAENAALRRQQQATEGALAARLARLERVLDGDRRVPARSASATRRVPAGAAPIVTPRPGAADAR